MPIRRYVEHGVVFTPEVLSTMSNAFTATTEVLEIGGAAIDGDQSASLLAI
jgi:hypothetical protein